VPLMFAGGVVQAPVGSEGPGVPLLVRGDDIDSSGQPAFVVTGQFSTRRSIDKHCVWQVSSVHMIDEAFQVGFSRARAQLIFPALEDKLTIVKHHLAAVHDAAHSQVYAPQRPEVLHTAAELAKESAADESGTDHSDRKSLARKIKGGMQRS